MAKGTSKLVPVLAVAGVVSLILAARASRNELGDTANAKIGGQIGTILSSISGIPGIGQVASLVAGLFGPSAHYTPSGMLFDTAANTLKSQAVELAYLQNELYTKVGNPTRVPIPLWTMTSADDPKTGPYIAQILNATQYASDTTPDALISDQEDGVYDAVIQVQQSMIDAIEHALDGLDDGMYTVYRGTVIPSNECQSDLHYCCSSGSYVECAPQATPQCANSSSIATQNSSAASVFPGFSNLSPGTQFAIGGVGVLGVILLLKRR